MKEKVEKARLMELESKVEIAKIEGPVHVDILMTRIRERFGYGKLTGT